MIINDLIPGVINKLRGRDDRTSLIPLYVKQVIFDLTQNYEFEELKTTGPLTNFEANKAEYSLDNNPFIKDTDVSLTFINSWMVWYVTAPVIGQDTGLEIKEKDLRVVEPMSKILGIPVTCCIFGSKKKGGKIIVGFMPNIAYATQMRYQRQHPFPLLNANIDALKEQEIFMPDDWQDIVEYAAAEKACDDLGMTDVGVLYHQKIYGNPSQKIPGLISERFSQQDRMKSNNEGQLKVIMRRY
jgi:hypothetical protein